MRRATSSPTWSTSLDEGRLGPLEVVEDDDEGPALGERLEELADGPERLLADGDARAAEPQRVRDQLADQVGFLLALQQLGDRTADGSASAGPSMRTSSRTTSASGQ